MWLCCAAPAVSDEDAALPMPSDSTSTAAEASVKPVALAKDPAAGQIATLNNQQQLILVNTDTSANASPKPGATPPSPTALTPSLHWQIQQQQQCGRRSIDVHSLAPTKSTAAVDVASGLGRAASCSLVPLTQDSLSTATALFGSFSAGQGFTRGKGEQTQMELGG